MPLQLPLLPVAEGAKVLDVGCGAGDLTAAMAARGADAVGVDIDPWMVHRARRRHPGIHFEVADAKALRFTGRDVVTAVGTYHHWGDQERGLASCAHALAAGGELRVVESRTGLSRRTAWEAYRVPPVPGAYLGMQKMMRWHGCTEDGLARLRGRMEALGLDAHVERQAAWAVVAGRRP